MKKRNDAVSFLQGPPLRAIFRFSIPVFLGNIVAVGYSWFDGVLVGKVLGNSSFAALAICGSFLSAFSSFSYALPVGMVAYSAQLVGKGDFEKVRKSFFASVWLMLVFGLGLSVLTLVLETPLLLMFGVKIGSEEMSLALSYSSVYSLFYVFILSYSFVISFARCLNDSKLAFLFVGIDSALNIFLDALMICVFRLGVWASALDFGLSLLVTVIVAVAILFHKFPWLRYHKGDLTFEQGFLRHHLAFGLPLAFQTTLGSIGGIIVSGTMSHRYGILAIEGVGAAARFSGLFGLFTNALACSVGPFVEQNYGANSLDRIKKGIRQTLLAGYVCSLIDFLVMLFAAPYVAAIFLTNPDSTVLAYCRLSLLFSMLGFLVSPLCQTLRFSLLGIGKNKWNLYSGVLVVALQSLCCFALANCFGPWAVVGASTISLIGDSILLSIGALKDVKKTTEKKSGQN